MVKNISKKRIKTSINEALFIQTLPEKQQTTGIVVIGISQAARVVEIKIVVVSLEVERMVGRPPGNLSFSILIHQENSLKSNIFLCILFDSLELSHRRRQVVSKFLHTLLQFRMNHKTLMR